MISSSKRKRLKRKVKNSNGFQFIKGKEVNLGKYGTYKSINNKGKKDISYMQSKDYV